jgi:hypothetical protein
MTSFQIAFKATVNHRDECTCSVIIRVPSAERMFDFIGPSTRKSPEKLTSEQNEAKASRRKPDRFSGSIESTLKNAFASKSAPGSGAEGPFSYELTY